MKLKSMKVDRAKRAEPMAVESDAPAYPWGLGLHLDEEVLEKLGIDLPEVGKSMMLVARVDVTGVSSNESQDGGRTRKNRNVSLQITDMALDVDQGEGAADKLYEKG